MWQAGSYGMVSAGWLVPPPVAICGGVKDVIINGAGHPRLLPIAALAAMYEGYHLWVPPLLHELRMPGRYFSYIYLHQYLGRSGIVKVLVIPG